MWILISYYKICLVQVRLSCFPYTQDCYQYFMLPLNVCNRTKILFQTPKIIKHWKATLTHHSAFRCLISFSKAVVLGVWERDWLVCDLGLFRQHWNNFHGHVPPILLIFALSHPQRKRACLHTPDSKPRIQVFLLNAVPYKHTIIISIGFFAVILLFSKDSIAGGKGRICINSNSMSRGLLLYLMSIL